LIASVIGKLPASAIAMLIVASTVIFGGLAVCLVIAVKRKP
jgi:hypothetical protein